MFNPNPYHALFILQTIPEKIEKFIFPFSLRMNPIGFYGQNERFPYPCVSRLLFGHQWAEGVGGRFSVQNH
jgi:hypothetical protein